MTTGGFCRRLGPCLLASALAAGMLSADVWDVQSDNDNGALVTDNELIHGTLQVHDLGALPGPAVDDDWYRIGEQPYSSYEVRLDEVSGDLAPGLTFSRVAGDGTTVLQNSVGESPLGLSRALRFVNPAAVMVPEFVRVGTPACGITCGADDTYRITAVETTIRVARFNNAGSQVTVLLTQNATASPINVTTYFWSTAGGAPLATRTIALAAYNLDAFNSATVAPSVGGHITIAHDGPHGGLNVKSVALEPATGFSFDTPGVYRPY
jgi:hypothetical protein